MIEMIVAYIEERGYEVRVIPDFLMIKKTVGGMVLGLTWHVPYFLMTRCISMAQVLSIVNDEVIEKMKVAEERGPDEETKCEARSTYGS